MHVINPHSLVARVFKGRYFRKTNPLFAKPLNSASFGWSSLLSARDLLLEGCRFQIVDGKSVSVWDDPWLPDDHPRPASGFGQDFYPTLRVNELLNPISGSWNVPLLRHLMDPVDVEFIRSLAVRPGGGQID